MGTWHALALDEAARVFMPTVLYCTGWRITEKQSSVPERREMYYCITESQLDGGAYVERLKAIRRLKTEYQSVASSIKFFACLTMLVQLKIPACVEPESHTETAKRI